MIDAFTDVEAVCTDMDVGSAIRCAFDIAVSRVAL